MAKKSMVGVDSLAGIVVVLVMVVVTVNAFDVGMILMESAVAKGAVCLDGSPPAYHFDKGSGTGVDNWIIFFEGGAWCNDIATCTARKKTRLGSSKYMDKTVTFSGFLGNNKARNPDFYNWNRIKVRYCDGASFTGDVEAVNPVDKLYFRGQRIFRAVIDELLAKGMIHAKQALLSGCSAGGLTTILNCDNFRALMPKTTKVKCLADAGFFIDGKDVSGTDQIRSFFNGVVTLQFQLISRQKTHNKMAGANEKCAHEQVNEERDINEHSVEEISDDESHNIQGNREENDKAKDQSMPSSQQEDFNSS